MEKKTELISTYREIITALQKAGSPEKAKQLSRFFKTGKGQYGEGDIFLGINVPTQRALAKQFVSTDFDTLHQLLISPWHEARLTALFILLLQFEHNKHNESFRTSCIDFYLSHTPSINNWDLVDLSCYKLLGSWLADKERSVLYRLAESSNLWEQRISIVTCMHFVRHGDFTDCLAIADKLLHHPHDLIQKAVGWLLREIGKKDRSSLTAFLLPRCHIMPRTMLRYAIEHYQPEERIRFLNSRHQYVK